MDGWREGVALVGEKKEESGRGVVGSGGGQGWREEWRSGGGGGHNSAAVQIGPQKGPLRRHWLEAGEAASAPSSGAVRSCTRDEIAERLKPPGCEASEEQRYGEQRRGGLADPCLSSLLETTAMGSPSRQRRSVWSSALLLLRAFGAVQRLALPSLPRLPSTRMRVQHEHCCIGRPLRPRLSLKSTVDDRI